MLADRRCVVRQLLTGFLFAVEHTQRVAFDAALADGAQSVDPFPQICKQLFAIRRAARRATDAIEQKLILVKPQTAIKLDARRDYFRVACGVEAADHLGTKLMKL